MRAGFALVAALVVGGCASLPPPKPAPPGMEHGAAQQARETALGLAGGDCAGPEWAMTGRLALSNGKEGGSGRIEWRQGGGQSEVTLSAPVTRQSWVLRVDGIGASLEGVPNGPVRGADPGLLLLDATGWDIPVAALGCWLRGARAGGSADMAIQFNSDGLPLRIAQNGWTVEYGAWTTAGRLPLPTRIEVRRGDSRVRLVVDRWGQE